MKRVVLACTLACGCAPAPAPIPSSAKPVEPAPTIAEEPDTSAPERSVEATNATWLAGLGKTGECKACLPRAEQPCAAVRERCTSSAACVAYLECARLCPPPESRDPKGGYPQADCVIACREKSTEGAEQGDAYLWCACCDSTCKAACGGECGHFKSGIAGPIGAGCD